MAIWRLLIILGVPALIAIVIVVIVIAVKASKKSNAQFQPYIPYQAPNPDVYCKNCGQPIVGQGAFCRNCGTKQDNAGASKE